MAYYSNVAIKCEEKSYNMLLDVCNTNNFKPDKIYKKEMLFILCWNMVVWQQSLIGPSAVINTMNELDKMDAAGYGYFFLRLGESEIDKEERYNDSALELNITREIEISIEFENINKE